MHQSQQELRHAAAKAFMEALDQLENSLAAIDDSAVSAINPTGELLRIAPTDKPTAPPRKIDSQPMSVAALEEAVADIEQFIRARNESGGDGKRMKDEK